ncbi:MULTISPECIES: thioredoxin-dependent thiol peroxidase [Pseudoalteromonas]|uniref:thioredoxin-dependent peroxiredoxin n=2 Tax=Pseudoalteromonas TaxID=53246 RepID=A0A0F4Q3I3_9GAMM|nr:MULTISPECIES: thioredoxin-dependent thiol peroxidase [Pseudoalteromonas]KJY98189.1 bacterioferritin comigratory protein [Pseudoalteromonas ruthenica]KJZ02256.1 bacterioferritin comigratory protein [Pseudoalteromonas ruthenica]MCF2861119.1 thioredoxin-dependent thiol peroxidase [Pseudoalteromonas sp. CNAT2-18]MCG7545012.1 thioredoxin-dependent thiol peroxidase [Pseudoalteromonas sp. MM17-2]MCG7556988.1 thioredoxin-dependent thiol peroxidase [Pseudoalteromonas sp. CNAT2-18.1]|tara:strand:- start:61 stop:537 length:477 start_codon:yes stop_codon:yes gene_type:complete
MNTLQAGDKAPLFNLQDQDGNPVSLEALLKEHQVLVYFYPKALTPGCTVQAEQLRDHKAALSEHNTVAVGISPDPVKKLKNFETKKELNFQLLSDEDHKVAEDFGVWGLKKFMGKEYDGIHRISFLIGQDGNIKHVFNKFKTKEHHQVVLDYLQEHNA